MIGTLIDFCDFVAFVGMTTEKTSLDALLAAREQLISAIHSRLDETSKKMAWSNCPAQGKSILGQTWCVNQSQ